MGVLCIRIKALEKGSILNESRVSGTNPRVSITSVGRCNLYWPFNLEWASRNAQGRSARGRVRSQFGEGVPSYSV